AKSAGGANARPAAVLYLRGSDGPTLGATGRTRADPPGPARRARRLRGAGGALLGPPVPLAVPPDARPPRRRGPGPRNVPEVGRGVGPVPGGQQLPGLALPGRPQRLRQPGAVPAAAAASAARRAGRAGGGAGRAGDEQGDAAAAGAGRGTAAGGIPGGVP